MIPHYHLKQVIRRNNNFQFPQCIVFNHWLLFTELATIITNYIQHSWERFKARLSCHLSSFYCYFPYCYWVISALGISVESEIENPHLLPPDVVRIGASTSLIVYICFHLPLSWLTVKKPRHCALQNTYHQGPLNEVNKWLPLHWVNL